MSVLFSGQKDLDRARLLASGFDTLFATDSKVESSRAERPRRLLFVFAGVSAQEERKLYIRLGVATVVALIILLAFRGIAALPFLGMYFGAEYLRINAKAFLRAQSFERDFAALLISLASSVRSGVDPIQALATAPELFVGKCEMKTELERFAKFLKEGGSVEEGVLSFGSTIAHPDIPLFCTAVLLNLREGASLSTALERLTRVVRQRQSFRRKTRSAVAMQRLSAIGIVAALVAILMIQTLADLEGARAVWADSQARLVLIGGLSLMTFGAMLMIRLCRSKL